MKEADIKYENGKHWVSQTPSGGFEVWKDGVTHATRCAQIGFNGAKGLKRAIEEADRRERV